MIRSQLLDNDNFGMYIEQEPYVRELIEAYINNRFKTVLEILERYSVSSLSELSCRVCIADAPRCTSALRRATATISTSQCTWTP